jgi:hypothetical protein
MAGVVVSKGKYTELEDSSQTSDEVYLVNVWCALLHCP